MAQRKVSTERVVTYDDEVDAAYLFVVDHIEPGAAVSQEIVEFPDVGEVILDFDDDGRLLGVEVLGASQLLPRQLLDRFSPEK